MDLKYRVSRRHWLGYYYSQLLINMIPSTIQGIFSQSYLLWIYFRSWNLIPLVQFLKYHHLTQLQALLDITIADNPEAVDGRFSLTYCFWSYNRGTRIFLRTFVNANLPIQSLTAFFPSSGWLEREAWDLFGVKFINHPDLRRILTDYGFRGHPLRKDFPLMGYLEIRYDDSYHCLIFEPVELSQEFRLFKFEMPWALWPAK